MAAGREIVDELKATTLFAQVSDNSLVEAAAAGVTEVDAGQVLAQAGDYGNGMFVVLDGQVVVELRQAQIKMGPGGFFGELALLVPDAERIARVRATTPARLLVIPRASFDELLKTEPSFALALLRELASRLTDVRTGS
ncbi:MAG TPA: cyclic nucleotide-binding domain-containing protein [Gaiellaceae bacterium]|jgi:CRP-like cAMP-binding protein|nr:cyclic nucleotide-binding domain-containing protein [Gaiellaceae bacterium]